MYLSIHKHRRPVMFSKMVADPGAKDFKSQANCVCPSQGLAFCPQHHPAAYSAASAKHRSDRFAGQGI